MNEKDKKEFLEDFKKAEVSKKLDMWYYALDQEGLWEEIIAEMSTIAQAQNPLKGRIDDE
jgi:hypothetical protein